MMLSLFQRWLSCSVGIPVALASSNVPCTYLDGAGLDCHSTANELFNLIPPLGQLLINTAAGLAILFVIIGGAQMIVAFGNESSVERGKTGVILALVGFGVALAAQAIVSYVGQHAEVVANAGYQNAQLNVMSQGVQLMLNLFNITFALVVIFAGFRMLLTRGDEGEMENSKKMLFWAAAGAIIVNISYALVQATLRLGF